MTSAEASPLRALLALAEPAPGRVLQVRAANQGVGAEPEGARPVQAMTCAMPLTAPDVYEHLEELERMLSDAREAERVASVAHEQAKHRLETVEAAYEGALNQACKMPKQAWFE
jgi:hypothetical protein